MPSEMLSGPDLGAGYLHQLTTDRDGDRTTYTYHAQDGGADANGPPKGPLDALGFVHPPSPCPFGGPRCWHRRFLLPFTETPKVRQTYNRHRFVLQAMIDQAHAGAVAAVETALGEIVGRVAAAREIGDDDWYVGGSTAAKVLGAAIAPHDIDLGVTRGGVDRLGAVLADYLIEPLATTDWPQLGIVRGARAFVGTFTSGARVEWAIPLEPVLDAPLSEWSPRPGVARLLTASLGGHSIRVSRPEYALVRAAEEKDATRFAAIGALVSKLGADRELLGVLLDRSPLSAPACDTVRRSAGV
jgi:hypothetical protein